MSRNGLWMRVLVLVSWLPISACFPPRPNPPPPPTCQDGIHNGAETGVDCGGPVCEPCPGDCGNRLILGSFTPTAGPVGTDVDLVGVGLRSVTILELNGVSVPFVVDNDNHIVFRVPAGVSSGAVTLTAPCGSVESADDFSVLRLRSQTTVASLDNPSIAGRPVTFTATVSASLPTPATPTGTVYFREGVNLLATAPLSGGKASVTVTLQTPGSYDITAEYGGDVNFEPNLSPDLDQVVNPNAPYIVIVPSVYDETESGTVFSDWLPGVAHSGPGDTLASGLLMRKNTTTATPVAAFGDVMGVEGFDASTLEFGFDYFLQGHCGAGSPRFNLQTTDGVTHFFGCRYGQHSEGAPGWGRVRYTAADALPPIPPKSTVEFLYLVMDEGTDTPRNSSVVTPGFAILDDFTLSFGNHQVVVSGPDPVYY
jgi:hypothetical protein